jgi:hypothetical protein
MKSGWSHRRRATPVGLRAGILGQTPHGLRARSRCAPKPKMVPRQAVEWVLAHLPSH